MRKFFLMSSALSLLATAGLLDSARADDLDVIRHTVPVAVTQPIDHALYCIKGRQIFGWTCDQELSAAGGPGNTDNMKTTLTPAPKAPPSPPCDHGPKGDV